MNNRIHRFLRATAIATLIAYLPTSIDLSYAASSSIPMEVAVPSSFKIEQNLALGLPAELGRIDSFQAGTKGTILHIQTAHGHYEAQEKIEKLLTWLSEKFGNFPILLEGAADQLDPSRLEFFPGQPEANLQNARWLAKKALVTGSELFLLQNKNATGIGVESEEAYRENQAQFVRVLRAKRDAEQFSELFRREMEKAATRFSPELRSFLKRLEQQALGIVPFDVWLPELQKHAHNHLKLDLTDAAWQVRWPMLVRFFKIQEMSLEMNAVQYESEKNNFLKEVKKYVPGPNLQATKGTDPYAGSGAGSVPGVSLFSRIELLLNSLGQSIQLHEPETENVFVEMLRYLPSDFNFKPYSQVTRFAGMLVLRSQLKPNLLSSEIARLEDLIAERLTKSEEEKKWLAIFADYRLLEKSLALQLTPSDFEKVQDRINSAGSEAAAGAELYPSGIAKRLNLKATHLDDLDVVFQAALHFYQGAKNRDQVMVQRAEKFLNSNPSKLAVVVTGGFHTEPMREQFQKAGYAYAVVTPSISGLDEVGYQAYLKAMLLTAAPEKSAPNQMIELPLGSGPRLGKETQFRRTVLTVARARTSAALTQAVQATRETGSSSVKSHSLLEGNGEPLGLSRSESRFKALKVALATIATAAAIVIVSKKFWLELPMDLLFISVGALLVLPVLWFWGLRLWLMTQVLNFFSKNRKNAADRLRTSFNFYSLWWGAVSLSLVLNGMVFSVLRINQDGHWASVRNGLSGEIARAELKKGKKLSPIRQMLWDINRSFLINQILDRLQLLTRAQQPDNGSDFVFPRGRLDLEKRLAGFLDVPVGSDNFSEQVRSLIASYFPFLLDYPEVDDSDMFDIVRALDALAPLNENQKDRLKELIAEIEKLVETRKSAAASQVNNLGAYTQETYALEALASQLKGVMLSSGQIAGKSDRSEARNETLKRGQFFEIIDSEELKLRLKVSGILFDATRSGQATTRRVHFQIQQFQDDQWVALSPTDENKREIIVSDANNRKLAVVSLFVPAVWNSQGSYFSGAVKDAQNIPLSILEYINSNTVQHHTVRLSEIKENAANSSVFVTGTTSEAAAINRSEARQWVNPNSEKILVVGTGFVGATKAILQAIDFGHDVVALDIIKEKLDKLAAGHLPFEAEHLPELLKQAIASGRLTFTDDYVAALQDRPFVYLALPTPQLETGEANTSFLEKAVRTIAQNLKPGERKILIGKSTAPPKWTVDTLRKVMEEELDARRQNGEELTNDQIQFAWEPEFLREAKEVEDDRGAAGRIVIGAENPEVAQKVANLYSEWDPNLNPARQKVPVILTDIVSAPLVKYAANGYRGLKISFISFLSWLTAELGFDINEIADAIGMDPRIIRAFLTAGPGFGGSCFPKDLAALVKILKELGISPGLILDVLAVNRTQINRFVNRMKTNLHGFQGKKVVLLGGAFKAGTSDMRESRALILAKKLIEAGAQVVIVDPAAKEELEKVFAEHNQGKTKPITFYESVDENYEAVFGNADAIAVMTEWPDFKQIDFDRILGLFPREKKLPLFFDGRNLFERQRMEKLGFEYFDIGRGQKPAFESDVSYQRRKAEFIKISRKFFLVLRISYINMIAEMAEKLGANILDVKNGLGLDPVVFGFKPEKNGAIDYLDSGIGWGGHDLADSLAQIQAMAANIPGLLYLFNLDRAKYLKQFGVYEEPDIDRVPFVSPAREINQHQITLHVSKIKEILGTDDLKGKKIAILGLTYKPRGTYSIEGSPSVALIEALLREGALVQAWDPIGVARASVKTFLYEQQGISSGVSYFKEPQDAMRDTDVQVMVHVTDQYESDVASLLLDKEGALVATKVLDARHAFPDPEAIRALGAEYHSIGVPSPQVSFEAQALSKDEAAAANRVIRHFAERAKSLPQNGILVVLGNPTPDYPQQVVDLIQKSNPEAILIVGHGGLDQSGKQSQEPEYERIERELRQLLAEQNLLDKWSEKFFTSENDRSMNTGENVGVVAEILARERAAFEARGISLDQIVLTQMPEGMLVSRRIFEYQWAKNAETRGITDLTPQFISYAAAQPVVQANESLSPEAEAILSSVVFGDKGNGNGQVQRLQNWHQGDKPFILWHKEDHLPKKTLETVHQLLARSEARAILKGQLTQEVELTDLGTVQFFTFNRTDNIRAIFEEGLSKAFMEMAPIVANLFAGVEFRLGFLNGKLVSVDDIDGLNHDGTTVHRMVTFGLTRQQAEALENGVRAGAAVDLTIEGNEGPESKPVKKHDNFYEVSVQIPKPGAVLRRARENNSSGNQNTGRLLNDGGFISQLGLGEKFNGKALAFQNIPGSRVYKTKYGALAFSKKEPARQTWVIVNDKFITVGRKLPSGSRTRDVSLFGGARVGVNRNEVILDLGKVNSQDQPRLKDLNAGDFKNMPVKFAFRDENGDLISVATSSKVQMNDSFQWFDLAPSEMRLYDVISAHEALTKIINYRGLPSNVTKEARDYLRNLDASGGRRGSAIPRDVGDFLRRVKTQYPQLFRSESRGKANFNKIAIPHSEKHVASADIEVVVPTEASYQQTLEAARKRLLDLVGLIVPRSWLRGLNGLKATGEIHRLTGRSAFASEIPMKRSILAAKKTIYQAAAVGRPLEKKAPLLLDAAFPEVLLAEKEIQPLYQFVMKSSGSYQIFDLSGNLEARLKAAFDKRSDLTLPQKQDAQARITAIFKIQKVNSQEELIDASNQYLRQNADSNQSVAALMASEQSLELIDGPIVLALQEAMAAGDVEALLALTNVLREAASMQVSNNDDSNLQSYLTQSLGQLKKHGNGYLAKIRDLIDALIESYQLIAVSA